MSARQPTDSSERARKRLALIAERVRELAKHLVPDVDTAEDEEKRRAIQFGVDLRSDLLERDGNPAK